MLDAKRAAALIQIGITLSAALLVTVGLAIARGGVGCEQVVIASSQEKVKFLKGLAKDYENSVRTPAWPGRCATIEVELARSGEAVSYLASSWSTAPAVLERPDVWSPASSAWLRLYEARGSPGPGAQDFGSLFESPLVIGMPQPMAKVLGWPGAQISLNRLSALATSPAGWSGVAGAGNWGAFRFGKTHPEISTSGLHALMAAFSAAGADVSPATVRSPAAIAFAHGIETSVLHYAPTAADFLRILCAIDARATAPNFSEVLAYLSAIAIEEKELVDYNHGKIAGDPKACAKPHVPLVAIYPIPGTFIADHPYALLSWSHKGAVANDFFEFVRRQTTLIDSEGFRDRSGRAGTQLAKEPAIVASPPTTLPEPSGAVIQAELTAWAGIRKPAHVLLLVHASVPTATKDILRAAIDRFSTQDSIGLASFAASSDGDATTVSVGIGPANLPQIGRVQTGITNLSGSGGNLQSALGTTLAEVQRSYDPNAVNAVVVVDLEPPSGPISGALGAQLQSQPSNQFVHVFTVGPSTSSLRDIALNGEGLYYEPKPGTDFLKDLISNF